MPRVQLVDDTFDSAIGAGWQTVGSWNAPGGYISPAAASPTVIWFPQTFSDATDSNQTEAIVTFDRISNGDRISVNPYPTSYTQGFDVTYSSTGANPTFHITRANVMSVAITTDADSPPGPLTIPAFADPTLATPTYIQPGDPCTVEIRYIISNPGPTSINRPQEGHVLINGTLRATFRTNSYFIADYWVSVPDTTSGIVACFAVTSSSTNTRISRVQLWRHQLSGYDQNLFVDTFTRANGTYLSANADYVYPGFASDGHTNNTAQRGDRLTISSNQLVMSVGDGNLLQLILARPTVGITDQSGRPLASNPQLRRELSVTWQSGAFELGVSDQSNAAGAVNATGLNASSSFYDPGSGTTVYLYHNEKATRRSVSYTLPFTPAAGTVFTLYRVGDLTAQGTSAPNLRLKVVSGANVSDAAALSYQVSEVSMTTQWSNALFPNVYLASTGCTLDNLTIKESLPFGSDSSPANPGLAAQVYTGYPSSSAGELY